MSEFEAAADAIITGDTATLQRLLSQEPQLIVARSTREHRATLLHYVSANGVEDYRQKTPKNIVEIAKILLDAGAEVDAECDAYGGGSTALTLTATSIHPEQAGVQIELMKVLLDYGARIDTGEGSTVNACLANGRGRAAEFLAERGARLDLEGACGVGNLERVKSFFNHDGSVKTSATQEQMLAGFGWACEFGRKRVVEFLLERGINIAAPVNNARQTGLHWAAYGGHTDIVRLLLECKAPVEIREERFQGTPLDWALYAWRNPPQEANRESYYEVIALLAQAGAKPDAESLQIEQLQSDARMLAALQGTLPPKA